MCNLLRIYCIYIYILYEPRNVFIIIVFVVRALQMDNVTHDTSRTFRGYNCFKISHGVLEKGLHLDFIVILGLMDYRTTKFENDANRPSCFHPRYFFLLRYGNMCLKHFGTKKDEEGVSRTIYIKYCMSKKYFFLVI